MTPNLGRSLAMSGELVPRLIRGLPKNGYYAGSASDRFGLACLPADTPLKYKIRTVYYEVLLRFRLMWLGLWRGLTMGESVGFVGRLHATYRNGLTGELVHLGLISTRVITNAGVTFLRDDFNNNAQDITNMNFHGCGTGTNAEAAGDTALQTESTTALNPDSTRATGTRSTPAGNQFRTVGTLTFDADAAITEHGILSQSGTGGGTLWDRSVFAAINVIGANADSIQFTYTLTINAGG